MIALLGFQQQQLRDSLPPKQSQVAGVLQWQVEVVQIVLRSITVTSFPLFKEEGMETSGLMVSPLSSSPSL